MARGVAGGNNRQTLTDEDAEGRHLYQSWCEAEGLKMGLDKMGNMFARREGTDASLPPVMVGSHLDTQPTGGKYDGVLGVLAGLEIIRTLNETGIKDTSSDRGCELDERRRHTLFAANDGIGCLCRSTYSGLGL